MRVAETHWAEADRKRFADLQAVLPAVLDTQLADWQARVDNGQTPYMAHSYLHVVRAMRYGRDAVGVWSPTGEERTYLVSTKSGAYRTAYDTVKRYLAAEFPNIPSEQWACGSAVTPQLVLDGEAKP